MRRIPVLVVNLVIIIILFSCKNEEVNTFHNQITSQQLLNKTEMFNLEGVDTYKINYKSEGLNIEGFIARPMQYKSSTKLPVIIYCRGGNQSFGMIGDFQLKLINQLASKGYVVLASQLRGNLVSEGIDEFGGKDVNDILKLIDIAKELDFVDAKNIHILGYSRGGMNTYQLSKLTDDINSVAVVGAPTNLFEVAKFRPRLYRKVFEPLVGDSIKFKDEYKKRSSLYWFNKINEPLLILHGTDDVAVAVEEPQKLIDSLTVSNKEDFKYKIFEGGNHGLSNFKQQRDSLIINWFKTHNK